jgi:hypothetical protein
MNNARHRLVFPYTQIMQYYEFTMSVDNQHSIRTVNVFVYEGNFYIWLGGMLQNMVPWFLDITDPKLQLWEKIVVTEIKKREFRKQLMEILA